MVPVFANTGTIGGGHPSLQQGGNRDNASCVSGRLGTDHRTGSSPCMATFPARPGGDAPAGLGGEGSSR